MKKFKFTLEGLLKLREFKEKRLKTELGEIVREMEDLKHEIAELGRSIVNYYEQQDLVFARPIQARDIQQFPNFIKGLKAKRVLKEKALEEAGVRYQSKLKEMAQAMADVKLVENLKEKRRLDFVKHEEKRLQQEIEESYIMRKRYEST